MDTDVGVTGHRNPQKLDHEVTRIGTGNLRAALAIQKNERKRREYRALAGLDDERALNKVWDGKSAKTCTH